MKKLLTISSIKKALIYLVFGMMMLMAGFIFKDQLGGLPSVLGIRSELIDFPDGYTMSTWVWESPDELSSQEVEELFAYSSREKINTIYIDVGKYVDITEESDVSIRKLKITSFENSVRLLIQEANQRNISVQALAGNTMWANSSHEYIPPLLLNYVFDFNKRNSNLQFSGFQYDIEFYNQSGYKANKSEFSSNYLNLVDKLVNTVKTYNENSKNEFKLGFAIPFWLDNQIGNYIFNSLADTLNKGKGSYLSIMAYRNYQSGRDGAINLIKGEVDYVENNTPNVTILVVQETDIGESPKTTFFGKSKQDLKHAFIDIADYFRNYRSFGGLAIHHFYSYKSLRDY